MAHYKVPALSIAFVENGRVMWSRAYGVGDVANGTRATVNTLEKVTLRRLLTHSAGATMSGFPGYESTVAVPITIQC